MSNTHSQSQGKVSNMSKPVFGDKIMTKTLSKSQIKIYNFTTDEEIFVLVNPSEKDREKQCFLILSLLSHNLTGKLIFSQKRMSKASNLIACCL